MLLYDLVAMNASYFVELLLRFDLKDSIIPWEYLSAFLKFAPIYTVFIVGVFFIFRLHIRLWRFASFSELNRFVLASGITTLFEIFGITVYIRRMPIFYYAFGAITQFYLITAIRFACRYISLEKVQRKTNLRAFHNAMIFGAGAAGQGILKELKFIMMQMQGRSA